MAAGRSPNAERRYRERWHTGKHHGAGPGPTVPDDIERRFDHLPCGFCGVRATLPCKHRPWVEAA